MTVKSFIRLVLGGDRDLPRTSDGANKKVGLEGQGTSHRPHLRQLAVRHAGQGFRADAGRGSESRFGNEHRRNVVDHRQHHLRHRPWLRKAKLLQREVPSS